MRLFRTKEVGSNIPSWATPKQVKPMVVRLGLGLMMEVPYFQGLGFRVNDGSPIPLCLTLDSGSQHTPCPYLSRPLYSPPYLEPFREPAKAPLVPS